MKKENVEGYEEGRKDEGLKLEEKNGDAVGEKANKKERTTNLRANGENRLGLTQKCRKDDKEAANGEKGTRKVEKEKPLKVKNSNKDACEVVEQNSQKEVGSRRRQEKMRENTSRGTTLKRSGGGRSGTRAETKKCATKVGTKEGDEQGAATSGCKGEKAVEMEVEVSTEKNSSEEKEEEQDGRPKGGGIVGNTGMAVEEKEYRVETESSCDEVEQDEDGLDKEVERSRAVDEAETTTTEDLLVDIEMRNRYEREVEEQMDPNWESVLEGSKDGLVEQRIGAGDRDGKKTSPAETEKEPLGGARGCGTGGKPHAGQERRETSERMEIEYKVEKITGKKEGEGRRRK